MYKSFFIIAVSLASMSYTMRPQVMRPQRTNMLSHKGSGHSSRLFLPSQAGISQQRSCLLSSSSIMNKRIPQSAPVAHTLLETVNRDPLMQDKAQFSTPSTIVTNNPLPGEETPSAIAQFGNQTLEIEHAWQEAEILNHNMRSLIKYFNSLGVSSHIDLPAFQDQLQVNGDLNKYNKHLASLNSNIWNLIRADVKMSKAVLPTLQILIGKTAQLNERVSQLALGFFKFQCDQIKEKLTSLEAIAQRNSRAEYTLAHLPHNDISLFHAAQTKLSKEEDAAVKQYTTIIKRLWDLPLFDNQYSLRRQLVPSIVALHSGTTIIDEYIQAKHRTFKEVFNASITHAIEDVVSILQYIKQSRTTTQSTIDSTQYLHGKADIKTYNNAQPADQASTRTHNQQELLKILDDLRQLEL